MSRADKDPVLDFKPLFYILDKCKNRVLAAKRQDKYEISGLYVKCYKKKWEMWPANFNSQLPSEFPERFDITMDEEEAWLFAVIFSWVKEMPEDWCLEKFPRAKDFPIY